MTVWVNQISASSWSTQNPTLEADSLGYESDTKKHKIGDGETPWNSLAYAGVGVDNIYPVGSVYLSISPTSPATLFGGTWAAFAQGRMLVGLKSTDIDFDVAEEIGGSKLST